jgi:hypothetical protein
MARTGILVALVAGLALAAPALSANPKRITSYCSTTGDVCYGVFRQSETYQLQLTTAARYFSRYTICSKPPTGAATCKRFSVRKRGKSFGGVVLFQLNFPHSVHGKYKVTWKLGAQPLGPALKFTYLPIVVA